jgi:hypothetical protein
MKATGAVVPVMLYSQWVATAKSIPEGLVSLTVGLVGVWLARWVFVNREERRLGKRQSWRETLPLTLLAMLVTGVTILERGFGLSASAFTGLGVGWVAVVILDVFGARVLALFQAGPASPIPPAADLSGHDGKVDDSLVEPDSGMVDSLRKLDQQEGKQ